MIHMTALPYEAPVAHLVMQLGTESDPQRRGVGDGKAELDPWSRGKRVRTPERSRKRRRTDERSI